MARTGSTSIVPRARAFSRRLSFNAAMESPASATRRRPARIWSSQPSTWLRVSGPAAKASPAAFNGAAAVSMTRSRARSAGRVGSAGGSSRLKATPTKAPINVVNTRVSAATSWLVTPRMSMALIGASSACSPSRRTLPRNSDAPIAAPRLHQVNPSQVERAVATRTPESTAPTRTAPVFNVE